MLRDYSVNKINHSLKRKNEGLVIEGCLASDLLEQFGSPLFVVSENHLRHNLRVFKAAFEQAWPYGEVKILPALKANPLLAVRRVLSDEGCGCDVFGAGELEGAIRGGVLGKLISVNGSIKDAAIISRAISIGANIVLDSPRELELCQQEAEKLQKTANVMFRIKPFMQDLQQVSDFYPEQQIKEMTQYIKYGIPTSELLVMGPRAAQLDRVNPVGIHVHMGRHSKHLEVWQAWVRHCVLLAKQLSDTMNGWQPQEINLGGGFASFSDSDTDVYVKGYAAPSLQESAQAIGQMMSETMHEVGFDQNGMTLSLEPGRGIHTDTGVHLSRIVNIKHETINRPRSWAEMDSSEVFLGITGVQEEPPFDFIIANKADQAATEIFDIVGQTCNAELLFNQVSVPALECGDVVALLNTGAYIEPMAANFNSLPRPGTVLVRGDQAYLIKRHETIDEVFSRDEIPDYLNKSETA